MDSIKTQIFECQAWVVENTPSRNMISLKKTGRRNLKELRRRTHNQIEGSVNGQIDRQIDKQIDKQINRQIDRQIDRQKMGGIKHCLDVDRVSCKVTHIYNYFTVYLHTTSTRGFIRRNTMQDLHTLVYNSYINLTCFRQDRIGQDRIEECDKALS